MRREEETGGGTRSKEDTYAEHAAHAEALHLAEAAQGLFGDVLNERVQCALEKRGSGGADLRVDADEIHECLVDVWSDLCIRRQVRYRSRGGHMQRDAPFGWGVSYQSICGSSTPLRTIAVSAVDLGLK